MKTATVLLLILILNSASAAPYYRFWRGEKLTHLSEKSYLDIMAKDFIPKAPKLFPHLTSYLVAIPPKGLGIDEVALLAYTNESEYLSGRATADGAAYTDAHWEIFERNTSKSLVPKLLGAKLLPNESYDLLDSNLDWSKGATYFFIGKKRSPIDSKTFLRNLDAHVRNVKKSFKPLGMKGYVILVTEDREYAWINWESEVSAQKAHSSPLGVKVLKEAEGIMETVQWTKTSGFNKSAERANAYFVKTQK